MIGEFANVKTANKPMKCIPFILSRYPGYRYESQSQRESVMKTRVQAKYEDAPLKFYPKSACGMPTKKDVFVGMTEQK